MISALAQCVPGTSENDGEIAMIVVDRARLADKANAKKRRCFFMLLPSNS